MTHREETNSLSTHSCERMSFQRSISSLLKLINRCQGVWGATPLIRHFLGVSATGQIISWPNYQAGISFGTTYATRFAGLQAANQFNWIFYDGSFVQMYFNLDPTSGEVLGAKMAYFPIPARCNTEFRFDQDSRSHNPIVHPLIHFQTDALADVRICSTSLPSPEAFFEYIVRSFHFQEWSRKFPSAASTLASTSLTAAQKNTMLNGSDFSRYMREMTPLFLPHKFMAGPDALRLSFGL